MQIITFLTTYLFLNAVGLEMSLGNWICGGLFLYSTVTLQQGGWRFSQFPFYCILTTVTMAYVVSTCTNWTENLSFGKDVDKFTEEFDRNVFYGLVALTMVSFRLESYFNWQSHMSTRRKLMISTWNAPSEGNIYGMLEIDMTKTLPYINSKRKEIGEKITVTHLVIKAVGRLLRDTPNVNGRLVFGRYYPAKSADVGCLVAIDTPQGPDLANCKIKDADKKTLKSISTELKGKARVLRAGKDEEFKKSKPLLRILPTFLIQPVVSMVGWLGALGFTIPALGVKAYPFGTAMVTSVGMLGLDFALVPHTPFAHVPLIVMIGKYGKRAVVNDEGKVVVKDILPITVTIDHRFLDGKTGGAMAKGFRKYLEDPASME